MEFDAAEVDNVGEAGGVVDYDLVGGAAGREGEGDGAEIGREIFGGAFLIEGLGLLAGGEAGSVDEALEDDGAVGNSGERAGRYGQEVADYVELGELDFLGEVELGGVRDADLTAALHGGQLR